MKPGSWATTCIQHAPHSLQSVPASEAPALYICSIGSLPLWVVLSATQVIHRAKELCRALERGMNVKRLTDLNESACKVTAQLTTWAKRAVYTFYGSLKVLPIVEWSRRHRRTPPRRVDGIHLLCVIAFFNQGIDENNLSWLFPAASDRRNISDKLCALSKQRVHYDACVAPGLPSPQRSDVASTSTHYQRTLPQAIVGSR